MELINEKTKGQKSRDTVPLKQCCGSETIYFGSSFEFSEFQIRIQARVPDPCGSGSNLYKLGEYIPK